MRKMKGVAAASMEISPSPYVAVYEDPKTIFKHQSLMQDYEELLKETANKKKELLLMRQKKLTLLAEVRFLRRRYKYLIQNQSQKPLMKQETVAHHKFVAQSRKAGNVRTGNGNDATSRHPHPNQRSKNHNQNQKGAAMGTLAPIYDQNQRQKKEVAFRNQVTLLDLNQREKIYSGKQATVQRTTPVFDLNQISREEEELEGSGEGMRLEEPKISTVRAGIDEQHNDMKLSACRNVGNGQSRSGKRKISWQDQVALRV